MKNARDMHIHKTSQTWWSLKLSELLCRNCPGMKEIRKAEIKATLSPNTFLARKKTAKIVSMPPTAGMKTRMLLRASPPVAPKRHGQNRAEIDEKWPVVCVCAEWILSHRVKPDPCGKVVDAVLYEPVVVPRVVLT